MCLFCSIVQLDIPATLIYEDDNYIVLDDIHPKSRIHMLLIPKRHIATISDMADSDQTVVG